MTTCSIGSVFRTPSSILPARVPNEAFAPAIVDALRAPGHDFQAGRIRQQAVGATIEIDGHAVIIDEAVDARNFDHHPVVAFVDDRLVLEDVLDAVRAAEANDATDCAIDLVIDALLARDRVCEIVVVDPAVEIHPVAQLPFDLEKIEAIRIVCWMPGFDFLFELGFLDGHAFVIREEFGKLFARTVIESPRAFFPGVLCLVDGPEKVGHHVADSTIGWRRIVGNRRTGEDDSKAGGQCQFTCVHHCSRHQFRTVPPM